MVILIQPFPNQTIKVNPVDDFIWRNIDRWLRRFGIDFSQFSSQQLIKVDLADAVVDLTDRVYSYPLVLRMSTRNVFRGSLNVGIIE